MTAVKAMNPAAHYKSLELRVGPETENVFNDTFFHELDGVANALGKYFVFKFIKKFLLLYIQYR